MSRDAMGKSIVVLGLGNLFMSDEGIGVRLVQQLYYSADEFPTVDFLDAGTGGLAVLHHIQGKSKAIIIDCAYMGEPPGTIKKFTSCEVVSTKTIANLSLHEADLLRIIDMARQLGQCPDEIIIFGIEPQVIKPGCELSKILTDRFDEYATMIRKELPKIISSPS
jgi:hydrogenase maturation protease